MTFMYSHIIIKKLLEEARILLELSNKEMFERYHEYGRLWFNFKTKEFSVLSEDCKYFVIKNDSDALSIPCKTTWYGTTTEYEKFLNTLRSYKPKNTRSNIYINGHFVYKSLSELINNYNIICLYDHDYTRYTTDDNTINSHNSFYQNDIKIESDLLKPMELELVELFNQKWRELRTREKENSISIYI